MVQLVSDLGEFIPIEKLTGSILSAKCEGVAEERFSCPFTQSSQSDIRKGA
jgi:hypothetical protein